MDFGLTGEQEQLADAERSWLAPQRPDRAPAQTLDTAADHRRSGRRRPCRRVGPAGAVDPGSRRNACRPCGVQRGARTRGQLVADRGSGDRLLVARAAPGCQEAGAAAEGELLVGPARAVERATSPVPMAADMDGFAVVRRTDDGEFVALVRDPKLLAMTTLDLSRSWARLDLDGLAARLGGVARRNTATRARRAGGAPRVRRARRCGAAARDDGRLRRASVNSSARRSARSRPSNTIAPTWPSGWRPAARRCGRPHWRWTALPMTSGRAPPLRPSPTRSPRPARSPAPRCRCTAASDSPGSTTCICSCAGSRSMRPSTDPSPSTAPHACVTQRGRPSPRSAMRFRMISELPPAIV